MILLVTMIILTTAVFWLFFADVLKPEPDDVEMEWYHWPLLIVILISGWATTFAIVGSVVFTIWGTINWLLERN